MTPISFWRANVRSRQASGSQFLAQLAEQPDRRDVLLALYATDGPSIRLLPAEQLGLLGEVVASDAVAAAYRTGLLAVGWRRRTHNGFELTLNPRSDHTVELQRGDRIVTIG
jgi:ion channel POLLUX/CASTOR